MAVTDDILYEVMLKIENKDIFVVSVWCAPGGHWPTGRFACDGCIIALPFNPPS